MNSHLSTPLKKIVADLIHTSNKFITINYVKMQYQTGTSDCGLFAIAAACSICHGEDPGQLKYKQEAMRALEWCSALPARSGTIYVVWVFHWRQKNAGTVNSVRNYACHVIYLFNHLNKI